MMKLKKLDNNSGKKMGKTKAIRLLKIFIVLILALGVLIVIAFSPLYAIKEIKALGSLKYTGDEIIRASGIRYGDNGFQGIGANPGSIFSLRNTNAEKAILEKLPYIKDATVKFIMPDKVEIHVIDREPHMMVSCLGAYLLVDNESYVLESFKEPVEGYPVVTGIDFSRYKLGQPLTCTNPDRLETAGKVINAIIESDKTERFKIYELVKSLDVEDVRNIRLFINGTLVANLGDIKDIGYKITFLKEAYFTSIKDTKGILDFTIGGNPTFRTR
ncbi:MAG TPA: FtsQ-type POTRA domain-containing protein [Clostridiaceae bacterium]|nr:FtsQ-type POTRA domain-containing protein [Clostridiaceae bacterium]